MPPASPQPGLSSRGARVRAAARGIPTLVIAGLALGFLLFALLWLSQRNDRAGAEDTHGVRTAQPAFDPLPTPSAGGARPAAERNPPPAPRAPDPAAATESGAPMVEELPTLAEPMPDVPATPSDPSPAGSAPATQPVPLAMPAPRFPPAALRRGAVGEVLLQVQVDADGGAASVEVIQSSGSRDLDRAAVEAAGRWRFQPATRDGIAVAGVVNVPIHFDARR